MAHLEIDTPAPVPDRVLFAEWGRDTPPLLTPGERKPCPICGHPTMDCTLHIKWIPQED